MNAEKKKQKAVMTNKIKSKYIKMAYKIRKLPNKPEYKVFNKLTGVVHSNSSTLQNAKKQVTLLNMIDHNVPLKKNYIKK